MDELLRTAADRMAWQLRAEVFALAPEDKLTGTVARARRENRGERKISQTTINQALRVLQEEGLVTMARGSGTAVLPRRRWRLLAEAAPGARQAGGDRAGGARALIAGLKHPAITAVSAEDTTNGGVRLGLVVESADAGGAVIAALPVVRWACGRETVTGIAVDPA